MLFYVKGVRFDNPVTLCTGNFRNISGDYLMLGIKNWCARKHGKDLIKFVRSDQDGIDVVKRDFIFVGRNFYNALS